MDFIVKVAVLAGFSSWLALSCLGFPMELGQNTLLERLDISRPCFYIFCLNPFSTSYLSFHISTHFPISYPFPIFYKFNPFLFIVLSLAQISYFLPFTKVQRLSFEYFTSRGCSTNRGEEGNWVTTISNSLSLYPICCLGPC